MLSAAMPTATLINVVVRRQNMRMWLGAAMCVALLGLSAFPFPVIAQQKTVRACQEEWRANKADNQAKGITEKAYVTECRAGTNKTPPPAAREDHFALVLAGDAGTSSSAEVKTFLASRRQQRPGTIQVLLVIRQA